MIEWPASITASGDGMTLLLVEEARRDCGQGRSRRS